MIGSTKLARWNTLIETFRNLGGTANNVVQREGPLGLGLFPIDSSQPVELRVPKHLLVDTSNLELRDGAVVIKDPSVHPKGFAEWYEGFQANYSWGAEARHSIETFEEGLKSLPDSLRQKLHKTNLVNIKTRYPGVNKEQELFRRFIATRQINHYGKTVMMPIIELTNHSPNESGWIVDKESIAVRSQYAGEVLVKYSASDPLHRFIQYGFNCNEAIGFSLTIKLRHRGEEIIINGGLNPKPFEEVNAIKKGQTVMFNQPLLSSRNAPKMPRALFKQSCKLFKNIESNELFDQIHLKNRITLIEIARDLENINNNFARQLKIAILNQIEILSEHLGTRKIE